MSDDSKIQCLFKRESQRCATSPPIACSQPKTEISSRKTHENETAIKKTKVHLLEHETREFSPVNAISCNSYCGSSATVDSVSKLISKSNERACSHQLLSKNCDLKSALVVNNNVCSNKPNPIRRKSYFHLNIQATQSRAQQNVSENTDSARKSEDNMLKVMKDLYDCYKKKNCKKCNCMLCGHLPREKRLENPCHTMKKNVETTDVGVEISKELKTMPRKHKTFQKDKAAVFITLLDGKSLEEKETIIRKLYMSGLPLPEPKTPAERALIFKVQNEHRHRDTRSALSAIATPASTGTADSSCICDARLFSPFTPPEKIRLARAAGLITPLQGKTPEQKIKILKGLYVCGIPFPLPKTASEKSLMDKLHNELDGIGMTIIAADENICHEQESKHESKQESRPETPQSDTSENEPIINPDIVVPPEQRPSAIETRIYSALKGRSITQKEVILKCISKAGLALPKGKTPSDIKLIAKVKTEFVVPQSEIKPIGPCHCEKGSLKEIQSVLSTKSKRKSVMSDDQCHCDIIYSEETQSLLSSKNTVINLKNNANNSKENVHNLKGKFQNDMVQISLFTPLKGKSPSQKNYIIRRLTKAGLPLPQGKTPSEKKLIEKIKTETVMLVSNPEKREYKTKGTSMVAPKKKAKGTSATSVVNKAGGEQVVNKNPDVKCDRNCGCDIKKNKLKHFIKFRRTTPDIEPQCSCSRECKPDLNSGVLKENDVTVGIAIGTPMYIGCMEDVYTYPRQNLSCLYLNKSYISLHSLNSKCSVDTFTKIDKNIYGIYKCGKTTDEDKLEYIVQSTAHNTSDSEVYITENSSSLRTHYSHVRIDSKETDKIGEFGDGTQNDYIATNNSNETLPTEVSVSIISRTASTRFSIENSYESLVVVNSEYSLALSKGCSNSAMCKEYTQNNARRNIINKILSTKETEQEKNIYTKYEKLTKLTNFNVFRLEAKCNKEYKAHYASEFDRDSLREGGNNGSMVTMDNLQYAATPELIEMVRAILAQKPLGRTSSLFLLVTSDGEEADAAVDSHGSTIAMQLSHEITHDLYSAEAIHEIDSHRKDIPIKQFPYPRGLKLEKKGTRSIFRIPDSKEKPINENTHLANRKLCIIRKPMNQAYLRDDTTQTYTLPCANETHLNLYPSCDTPQGNKKTQDNTSPSTNTMQNNAYLQAGKNQGNKYFITRDKVQDDTYSNYVKTHDACLQSEISQDNIYAYANTSHGTAYPHVEEAQENTYYTTTTTHSNAGVQAEANEDIPYCYANIIREESQDDMYSYAITTQNNTYPFGDTIQDKTYSCENTQDDLYPYGRTCVDNEYSRFPTTHNEHSSHRQPSSKAPEICTEANNTVRKPCCFEKADKQEVDANGTFRRREGTIIQRSFQMDTSTDRPCCCAPAETVDEVESVHSIPNLVPELQQKHVVRWGTPEQTVDWLFDKRKGNQESLSTREHREGRLVAPSSYYTELRRTGAKQNMSVSFEETPCVRCGHTKAQNTKYQETTNKFHTKIKVSNNLLEVLKDKPSKPTFKSRRRTGLSPTLEKSCDSFGRSLVPQMPGRGRLPHLVDTSSQSRKENKKKRNRRKKSKCQVFQVKVPEPEKEQDQNENIDNQKVKKDVIKEKSHSTQTGKNCRKCCVDACTASRQLGGTKHTTSVSFAECVCARCGRNKDEQKMSLYTKTKLLNKLQELLKDVPLDNNYYSSHRGERLDPMPSLEQSSRFGHSMVAEPPRVVDTSCQYLKCLKNSKHRSSIVTTNCSRSKEIKCQTYEELTNSCLTQTKKYQPIENENMTFEEALTYYQENVQVKDMTFEEALDYYDKKENEMKMMTNEGGGYYGEGIDGGLGGSAYGNGSGADGGPSSACVGPGGAGDYGGKDVSEDEDAGGGGGIGGISGCAGGNGGPGENTDESGGIAGSAGGGSRVSGILKGVAGSKGPGRGVHGSGGPGGSVDGDVKKETKMERKTKLQEAEQIRQAEIKAMAEASMLVCGGRKGELCYNKQAVLSRKQQLEARQLAVAQQLAEAQVDDGDGKPEDDNSIKKFVSGNKQGGITLSIDPNCKTPKGLKALCCFDVLKQLVGFSYSTPSSSNWAGGPS